MQKQVDKSHYDFERYIRKPRWASMWHQVAEVLAFEPSTVLEIGPGPGVFKALASRFGPRVETLDIDPDLKPDHVVPADEMPFEDNAFDVVCAFQMLEHVPYEKSLAIFAEMSRVSSKGLVISLPDAASRWPLAVHIPRIGLKWLSIPRPRLRPMVHNFDGEHYWEINKAGYPASKVAEDLLSAASVKLIKTFRVDENPYHRFFVFSTSQKSVIS
ncbi:class I SAM-dependent methyltransferase [Polycyclovorans algicola]|uniref:class I SAM-dependent methyltransferase n=1 Tax=Polycyclovorans algicola TaxID=616992 RepID=UPI000A02D8B8|nr:class I SAM-dependent methyltransferase [Polycyclovorans algicola]